MPYPFHPPCFEHCSNIWWSIHIMQITPTFCYFLLLRSKYSPQHPVLKHHCSIWSIAFTTTEFNEVFTGNQLRQVAV
jgi:hypothetical protein